MQLFAHAAHNLVSGPSFAPDHDFFGSAYAKHEGDFDDVVERVIGQYGEQHVDFAGLTMQAAKALAGMKISGAISNEQFFQQQLNHEQVLCSLVDQLCATAGVSEGTKQLLGNIADMSEGRQYKIKQRLG
jgi:DNA-binding ferritin-like protein